MNYHFFLIIFVVSFCPVLMRAGTQSEHDYSEALAPKEESKHDEKTSTEQHSLVAEFGKGLKMNSESTLEGIVKYDTKDDTKNDISTDAKKVRKSEISIHVENGYKNNIVTEENTMGFTKRHARKVLRMSTNRETKKDRNEDNEHMITSSDIVKGTILYNKRDTPSNTKSASFPIHLQKPGNYSSYLQKSAPTNRQDKQGTADLNTQSLTMTVMRSLQRSQDTSLIIQSSVKVSSFLLSSRKKRDTSRVIDVVHISEANDELSCDWSHRKEEPKHIENATGRLEWEEPTKNCCCIQEIWHIQPDVKNKGLVLHFTHFNFKQYDSLEVYKDRERTEDNLLVQLPNLTTAVQLLPHQQVYIWVRTSPHPPSATENSPSSFSLNYATHPVQHLPLASSLSPVSTPVTSLMAQKHMYNCSHPYTIPDYIRCDMVQQCIEGEDEPADCPYKSVKCGEDWFPYIHKCLKIVIREEKGYGGLTCEEDHGGKLAVLPEPLGRKVLGDVVGRMGIEGICLTVDLKGFSQNVRYYQLFNLYRYMWEWGEEGIVDHGDVPLQQMGARHWAVSGSFLISNGEISTQPQVYGSKCGLAARQGVLCMKAAVSSDNRQKSGLHTVTLTLRSSKTNHDTSQGNTFPMTFPKRMWRREPSLSVKLCADRSFVQVFHRCPLEGLNVDWSPNNLKLFDCMNGEKVHYTLVCDGTEDCPDGSDEWACANFVPSEKFFLCSNRQFVLSNKRCDGAADCLDESDEKGCEKQGCSDRRAYCDKRCVPSSYVPFLTSCQKNTRNHAEEEDKEIRRPVKYIYPPAVMNVSGFGMSNVEKLEEGQDSCPDTHFQCPEGFCIPTYLLNNKVLDCPLGHDENITDLACPGFYRCYQTSSCLHPDLLCDGINHCPLNDDELHCSTRKCPSSCICEGQAVKCHVARTFLPFTPADFLRYIDLSGSDKVYPHRYARHPFIFFNLSFCNLERVSLSKASSLQILDLSHNNISDFESLRLVSVKQLLHLNLSFNPLSSLGHGFTSFVRKARLLKLRSLTLMGIGLEMIMSNDLAHLPQLSVLDIRLNSDVGVEDTVIFGKSLRVLYTDNPKLCCPDFYPAQPPECHAPVDELSSCSDLLKSDLLRVLLWALAALALTGNFGVLIYRVFLEQHDTSPTYRRLVINLSGADFLMGIYMTMIGGADIFFRGNYLMKAEDWRHSGMCKAAGFLAMVSSEVSALVICLITLDRLLILHFPFSKRLRPSAVSASLTCTAAWITGVVLATVPLTQSHWNFYSQNSICLPLPITRHQFKGQQYAFGVFIVLNFILFLFIGAGQCVIYHSIRSSSKAMERENSKQEMAIARHLFLIVLTDFCCWFPIGLMGLLAARGTPIPGVVNVWAAVFILPFNSALNPFLYTISTLQGRRAKTKDQKRLVKMISSVPKEIHSWKRKTVKELTHQCLRSGLVEREDAMELILPCLRSGLVKREDAVKLIQQCLTYGLVDMEQLLNVWTSQLGHKKQAVELVCRLISPHVLKREDAMKLMLHCLRTKLVDMDHFRDMWTSQLEKGEEGTEAEASEVALQTFMVLSESETDTTVVEVHGNGVGACAELMHQSSDMESFV